MSKVEFNKNFIYKPCKNCIICNTVLTDENKSKKSVFTKWLLEWFDEKDIIKNDSQVYRS